MLVDVEFDKMEESGRVKDEEEEEDVVEFEVTSTGLDEVEEEDGTAAVGYLGDPGAGRSN